MPHAWLPLRYDIMKTTKNYNFTNQFWAGHIEDALLQDIPESFFPLDTN